MGPKPSKTTDITICSSYLPSSSVPICTPVTHLVFSSLPLRHTIIYVLKQSLKQVFLL